MEYEHELAIQQFKLDYSKLPLSIKGHIANFKRRKKALDAKPDPKEELRLKVYSATITDEIITLFEKDKPDKTPQDTPPADFTQAEKDAVLAEYLTRRAARKLNNQQL